MERDRFEILRQIIRITHGSSVSPPKRLKNALKFLRRALDLGDACLALFNGWGRNLELQIRAGGTDLLVHNRRRLVGTPEALALQLRQSVRRDLELYFPIYSGRRRCGVLVLLYPEPPAAGEPDEDLLQAIGVALLPSIQALHTTRPPRHPFRRRQEDGGLLRMAPPKPGEISLLYGISRAMHSTLRLNDLVHLILSAVTSGGEFGFDRAMLFMVNERSGTLQGMLGVDRQSADLVLPQRTGDTAWDWPCVKTAAMAQQQRAPLSRTVMRQRLPLDPEENALARAALEGQVVLVADPAAQPPSGRALAKALKLAPYVCTPLLGRDRPLGVLVVDNRQSGAPLDENRLRFLELFASQAGQAIENALLVQRLEAAHQDLRESQERLLQGEKLATIGEMAASVAHELRNPLVSVGGFAQRLARIASAGSRAQEYAAIIAREVRRLEEMLTNILAFSKQNILCLAGCRLSGIVEEALALEEEMLRRQSIRLILEIQENLPSIQGDEQKLRQVLLNLLDNAKQAMPHGGQLNIRLYKASLRGEPAVALEVEDTGGGIPPEVMRNIFNPFFTTRESGTGLGLPISQRIIEQHRGEIEVLNQEKGALFVVRLPVKVPGHLSVDNRRGFG